MIHSMTAYASRTGRFETTSWVWEMRSVNARGLDVRLRLPEGLDGLEQSVRGEIKNSASRGNISVTLRISREESEQALSINDVQLDSVLKALDQVQDRAFNLGVTLGQPTSADVLQHRGVLVAGNAENDQSALVDALKSDFSLLLSDFLQMRRAEGVELEKVLTAQANEIENLTKQAEAAAEKRKGQVVQNLKDAFDRVMSEVGDVDEGRLEQELAAIAVKQDVTEEIDRLYAHITAAHAMIADPKPMGRKMDFLTQEFNREANTLCSKAQNKELTAVGLDLKATIDQMREQIQNVE